MKRAFPHKLKPVDTREIDSDSTAEPSKQAIGGTSKVRSAAMIGLAISVGASSILLPRGGDTAVAADPPTTTESTAEMQPASPEATESVAISVSPATKASKNSTLWEFAPETSVEPIAVGSTQSETRLQLGQLKLSSPTELGGNIATLPDRSLYLDPQADLRPTPVEIPGVSNRQDLQNVGDPIAPTRSSHDESLRLGRERADRWQPGNRFESRAEFGFEESTSSLNGIGDASRPQIQEGQPRSGEGTSVFELPALPGDKFNGLTSQPGIASVSEATPSSGMPYAPGTVIIEPSSTTDPEVIYRVQVGDTLNAIAQNHGISVAELIAANHLSDPHYLKVNQPLKIPQGSGTNTSDVAVQPGTTPVIELGRDTVTFANQSILEIAAPGLDPDRPTVPMIPPLAVATRDSVPTVPQGNIQLTPTLSTGVPTVQLALNKTGSKFVATPENNSSVEWVNEEAPASALPTQPGASELMAKESQPISSSEANPYADRLRAEITRLRAEYRADRENPNPTPVSVKTGDSQPTQASTPTVAEPVNPEYNPSRYMQSVQDEISRPQGRQGSQPRQPVVATAPIGANAYDPLSNPALGQMVSPELPPLSGAEAYLPGAGGSTQSKGFIWPAKGVLTSGYGWRWGRMHKGIDIAGPVGTPIVAVDDGVVTYAGWNDGGYGYLVEVTHTNGSQSLYAHNSRILVKEGQRVAQGQQISEMGSTGFSTGPHLHFEIHPAGQGAVNPMAFLPQDSSTASR